MLTSKFQTMTSWKLIIAMPTNNLLSPSHFYLTKMLCFTSLMKTLIGVTRKVLISRVKVLSYSLFVLFQPRSQGVLRLFYIWNGRRYFSSVLWYSALLRRFSRSSRGAPPRFSEDRKVSAPWGRGCQQTWSVPATIAPQGVSVDPDCWTRSLRTTYQWISFLVVAVVVVVVVVVRSVKYTKNMSIFDKTYNDFKIFTKELNETNLTYYRKLTNHEINASWN